MATITTQRSIAEIARGRDTKFKSFANSRWTFILFQVLDLLSTLIAFHYGALEANPLVAHFTTSLGWVRGLIVSKLIAIAIAMGVKRLLWVVNILYAGIIIWNLMVLLSVHTK